MLAQELMEIYLQIKLLLGETTMANSEFLVDEFDRKDGLWSMDWYGFLDA